MAFDALADRVASYEAALRARGVPTARLTALGAFLDAFRDAKPTAFFQAAEIVISGTPLPESENAVRARGGAKELDAIAPLLKSWRAPKATIGLAEKLSAFLKEHAEWSLRSIEIMVGEELKRIAADRPR